jgi:7-carboxy-7-deazaguanine synthase
MRLNVIGILMLSKILIDFIKTDLLDTVTLNGLPASIVRLSSCEPGCDFIDSRNDYDGCFMEIETLGEHVRSHEMKTVLFAGSEPLSQEGCHQLVELLRQEGKDVIVESCDTIELPDLSPDISIIFNLACPSLGSCRQIQ